MYSTVTWNFLWFFPISVIFSLPCLCPLCCLLPNYVQNFELHLHLGTYLRLSDHTTLKHHNFWFGIELRIDKNLKSTTRIANNKIDLELLMYQSLTFQIHCICITNLKNKALWSKFKIRWNVHPALMFQNFKVFGCNFIILNSFFLLKMVTLFLPQWNFCKLIFCNHRFKIRPLSS